MTNKPLTITYSLLIIFSVIAVISNFYSLVTAWQVEDYWLIPICLLTNFLLVYNMVYYPIDYFISLIWNDEELDDDHF